MIGLHFRDIFDGQDNELSDTDFPFNRHEPAPGTFTDGEANPGGIPGAFFWFWFLRYSQTVVLQLTLSLALRAIDFTRSLASDAVGAGRARELFRRNQTGSLALRAFYRFISVALRTSIHMFLPFECPFTYQKSLLGQNPSQIR